MNKTLLLAGVGKLNSRVAEHWLQQGGRAVGFRRSEPTSTVPFEQHSLDLSSEPWPDVQADCVVVALSVGERNLDSYRRTYVDSLQQLAASCTGWQRMPERILVVSSSRVYGEDAGGLIDDETKAETDDDYGQLLLKMEQIVHSIPCQTSALRLSGIYGPGRDWLKRQALKATPENGVTNKWTNRIHIDDAAAAIAHLLQLPSVAPHYIVSDQQPQTQLDMFNYFRANAGVPLLSTKNEAVLGKRLKPTRLRQSGYKWHYPHAFSGGYDAT